jgi:hypothetical protein
MTQKYETLIHQKMIALSGFVRSCGNGATDYAILANYKCADNKLMFVIHRWVEHDDYFGCCCCCKFWGSFTDDDYIPCVYYRQRNVFMVSKDHRGKLSYDECKTFLTKDEGLYKLVQQLFGPNDQLIAV